MSDSCDPTPSHYCARLALAGAVALVQGVLGAPMSFSEPDDPIRSFWDGYARNFSENALAALQVTCVIERKRIPGDPGVTWETIRAAKRQTLAWYENTVTRPYAVLPQLEGGAAQGPQQTFAPPTTQSHWCTAGGTYEARLYPPPMQWRIGPSGDHPERSRVAELVRGLLHDYGFRPDGVPFPADSGVEFAYDTAKRVVEARFPGHRFEYYLSNAPELEGLPSQVRMLNPDGQQIANWLYKGWAKFGRVWLPRKIVKTSFLNPKHKAFDDLLPEASEIWQWHLLDARFDEDVPGDVFVPRIPAGATVIDSRFGTPITYPYDHRRTVDQLLDMAKQEQIKRGRR